MAYLTIDAKDFGMVTVRKTKSSIIISSLRDTNLLPHFGEGKKKRMDIFKVKLPYSWVENLVKSLMSWALDVSTDITPRRYPFPKKLGGKKVLYVTKNGTTFTGWIPYNGEKKKIRLSLEFLSKFITVINTTETTAGDK